MKKHVGHPEIERGNRLGERLGETEKMEIKGTRVPLLNRETTTTIVSKSRKRMDCPPPSLKPENGSEKINIWLQEKWARGGLRFFGLEGFIHTFKIGI